MARGQGEMRDGPSRCAIYTRQSSNTDTDLTSCQVQFDACRSFLEAHRDNGWIWIGERFDDEGWSGATLDRPALQRLLAKIREGNSTGFSSTAWTASRETSSTALSS